MLRQRIIEIKDGQAGNPAARMAHPLDLTIFEGEQVAVVGDNAAGKTRLVESLTGTIPIQGTALRYDFSPSPLRLVSENIKYIAFRDTYDGADNNYYLQKRWNRQDIDDDTPTAGALLDKFIITLSSGELRKFQLTRTLLSMPRVLVLDNPFIGLDASTRDSLSELLGSLAGSLGLLLILVLPRPDAIPGFITHVIPVEGMEVLPKVTKEEFLSNVSNDLSPRHFPVRDAILSFPGRDLSTEPFYPKDQHPEIVRCSGITIRYGDRTILKDFDWTVHEGERWALTGENGSGKSTLLSLVCADNPQGYACDISLFGHKRGTGESIWEIKRHIGYVSPEMHRAYLKNIPALDIVASGLFDTVGLFMHPTEAQLDTCREWMLVFGIAALAGRPYLQLSSGEQRLCLLARAFVKDPELLILDEPMHGLDLRHSALVKDLIDAFMERAHKTLVMVTHYESELPSCIDRRLTLKRN